MTTLYVLQLANGLYRKVHPTLSNVAALSLEEAKRAKAGHPGSIIEPFHRFEIYPIEFDD
jgi:hypothetical protein